MQKLQNSAARGSRWLLPLHASCWDSQHAATELTPHLTAASGLPDRPSPADSNFRRFRREYATT
jgi:hypothetical protein